MQTMRLSASSAGMFFFFFLFLLPGVWGKGVGLALGPGPIKLSFTLLKEKILDCDCHQTELRGLVLGQGGESWIPSLSAP